MLDSHELMGEIWKGGAAYVIDGLLGDKADRGGEAGGRNHGWR